MRHPATFEVAVDGGSLRVGSWGAGPDLVLAAHGITGNHLHFAALADRLTPNFALVAPDLRGRGRSSQIVGPFSIATHADDLVAVLDFLGVEKATVIGHSMGGFAAVVCADRHPDRVRDLVLIDGGLPLDLGRIAELPTDRLLAALLGPALDRLSLTFESVAAYVDYWRRHPAFIDAWNPTIENAIRYDLGGYPPQLRSSVRSDAVVADVESELEPGGVDNALRRLTVPATLLRAERGILNQQPLYQEDFVAAWLAAVPSLRSRLIPAVNHYTILLTAPGAEAIWDAITDSHR